LLWIKFSVDEGRFDSLLMDGWFESNRDSRENIHQ
jgi:hypothetical protein